VPDSTRSLATSTEDAGGPEPRFCTFVFIHKVCSHIVAAAESNAMRAGSQFAASDVNNAASAA